jgi:DNA polymerase-3 subunit gamma/tau
VYRIVDALVTPRRPALLAEVDAMALRSVAFASALENLASLFHRIAVAQTVPQAVAAMEDADRVAGLAARLAPEMVQLAYQICVQGRTDLPLAPDEMTGFSMTVLALWRSSPLTAR